MVLAVQSATSSLAENGFAASADVPIRPARGSAAPPGPLAYVPLHAALNCVMMFGVGAWPGMGVVGAGVCHSSSPASSPPRYGSGPPARGRADLCAAAARARRHAPDRSENGVATVTEVGIFESSSAPRCSLPRSGRLTHRHTSWRIRTVGHWHSFLVVATRRPRPSEIRKPLPAPQQVLHAVPRLLEAIAVQAAQREFAPVG